MQLHPCYGYARFALLRIAERGRWLYAIMTPDEYTSIVCHVALSLELGVGVVGGVCWACLRACAQRGPRKSLELG